SGKIKLVIIYILDNIYWGSRHNMRDQPAYFIDKDAVKVWRISSGITIFLIWGLIIGAYMTLSIIFFEIQYMYIGIAILILSLLLFIFVYLIPKLRYRRWRYEIFEQEI